MTEILLTQHSGKILGPIAKLLGVLLDLVYNVLSKIGIENIGFTIIVFTIVIYTILLPITYSQQKFSIMSKKMNPELQVIQKKYKGKKDQESQMKQAEETQMLYQKYGVSPTGSCLPVIVQMVILFALYRVIYNVPAYVSSIKEVFQPAVTAIMSTEGYADLMTGFVEAMKLAALRGVDFAGDNGGNYIIDALYSMNTSGWTVLKDTFPALTDTIAIVQQNSNHLNSFLGLNISNSPFNIIRTSFAAKNYLNIFVAFMIPICSYLTQVINIKLMPQPEGDVNDQMAQQMKTMNRTMPLFSLVMCFTVPVGLGIYWVASALVRGVQQVVINKRLEKIDIEAIIEKNQKKAEKKREKMGIAQNQIYNNASINTRSSYNNTASDDSDRAEKVKSAYDYAQTAKTTNPNSLTAKANLVKDFNEKNNK